MLDYQAPRSSAPRWRVASRRCSPATPPTVWKLDRLGRSPCDLITTLDSLRVRKIKFRSITEA
jgi:hypothetical protein